MMDAVTTPAARAVSIRALSEDDSPALAELYTEDREFLRRWDPARPDEFYTVAGQRAAVAAASREAAAGRMWTAAILLDDRLVGRVSLNGILRGPLQSAFLGYWVSRRAAGRGVATAAVARCLETAFGDLGLHRIDAYAREENIGSCRVLEKNGFRRTGHSYGHVYVDGRWRDDIVFQRLAPWHDGVRRSLR